ncbi:MAG: hypothetical protein WD904_12895 [Dehalococcoidia bacterium]
MSQIKLAYLPIAALLVLLVAIAVGLAEGESNATSADSATSDASPTPGTAPVASAIVSVRNTLDGVPLIIGLGHLELASVNGERCSTLVTGDIFEALIRWTAWPWNNKAPCNMTGVPVRLCHDPLLTYCSDEFIFDGEDVLVDMEWGSFPGILDAPATTVRFSHDGVAQPVTLLGWEFRAGAVYCGAGGVQVGQGSAVVTGFVRPWALKQGCTAPSLDVIATFATEEFGELEGAFTWLGADLTLDVDTGFLLGTPTAAPTAPASPQTSGASLFTPAGLPAAGGPPPQDTRKPISELVVMAMAAVAAAGVGVAVGRRRVDTL